MIIYHKYHSGTANSRSFGSEKYISGNEKLLYDRVVEKLALKKQAAVESGLKLIYLKAWRFEDEILSENPPEEILSMNHIYRLQIISKSFHKEGAKRQGRHNHQPSWVIEL